MRPRTVTQGAQVTELEPEPKLVNIPARLLPPTASRTDGEVLPVLVNGATRSTESVVPAGTSMLWSVR